MYSQKEIYRQSILGRLQKWERELAQLRSGIAKLEGDVRERCDAWLEEVEVHKRDVFNRYADLLAAKNGDWDEKRTALDVATEQMETKLMDFAIQAHPAPLLN